VLANYTISATQNFLHTYFQADESELAEINVDQKFAAQNNHKH